MHKSQATEQNNVMNPLSRKIDSPAKRKAVAIGFAVLFFIVVLQFCRQSSIIETLRGLNRNSVIEVNIAGRSFSDAGSIEKIMTALNLSTAYTSGNEGCIPPYQMTIKLTTGQELIYVIGKSRKSDTIILQPSNSNLPDCITGGNVSSKELFKVLNDLNYSIIN
jgi:hypothetical protein